MTIPIPLQSALLAEVPGVRHGFFTRHGGVSTGIYNSLNVGRGSDDDPDRVAINRTRIAEALGAPSLNTAHQVHSNSAVTLHMDLGDALPRADALVTATPGLICGALSADCAPILIVDPKARIVAAVHAGWRGALAGIVEAAVARMVEHGAASQRMIAAVGPCIGPASYEVGLEYKARFVQADRGNTVFFKGTPAPGKLLFDLPGYVLRRLRKAGVQTTEWIGRDTAADPDFFSNRRAAKQGEQDYGRLVSAIVLTG